MYTIQPVCCTCVSILYAFKGVRTVPKTRFKDAETIQICTKTNWVEMKIHQAKMHTSFLL